MCAVNEPSPRPGQIDSLAARCRSAGLPLTAQRRAVYETLLDHADHPTADAVFDEVRRRIPEIGRTTVYRALDRLVRLGLAIRVHRLGLAARFDPNTGRYDHAVCVGCGSMEDLAPPPNDADHGDARSSHLARRGFEVIGHTTQVHVLCPSCRSKGTSHVSTPEGNRS